MQAVFAELAQTRPAGIRYSAYRLEDGLSFVHHAVVSTADGSNPLPQLEAFKAFVSDIKERCDEPPLAMGPVVTANYRKKSKSRYGQSTR